MVLVQDVTQVLEAIAPLHLQESYDNAGLIVGRPNMPVGGILCSLDCTEAVVEEAIANGCNLIISHHPIVFRGLKRFNEANYIERVVAKAIRHDIALYAIHTNLDNVLNKGVNQRIAQKIGLTNLRILAPRPNDPQIGAGVIGQLHMPIPTTDFLQLLRAQMQCAVVRHTVPVKQEIQTVAICGGSGSFLLQTAIAASADAFVTADFKYHEFFDADGHLMICDIGHFESEQFTSNLLTELLSEKFLTFAVRLSNTVTNPIRYWVE